MQRSYNTSEHKNLKIKMLGILAVLSAGMGTGLAGIWIFNSIMVLGTGVLLILISSRLGYTFVKCPKCNKSIYKNLISNSSVWLLKVPENCPLCKEKFD
ncbi:MAG: hypothetical protein Q8M56_01935 [Desulfobacterales bacterium]|jgi:hypothetical protein|nr:hypothetical protein [Desulfobacterales bacterium]